MDNHKDIENISQQLKDLKEHIYKSKEYLFALEMTLVDGNNSRLKDSKFAGDIQELDSSFENLQANIKSLENKLYS